MNTEKKIRTRIAPSPTGFLHLGTAHTALFNYLFARKYGGDFIVRIEDTDNARSEKRFEDDILSGLSWLGLNYDEMARQSERTDLYTKKIEELLSSDNAYISKELAKDGSGREVEVVRLRNPGKHVSFNDVLRGVITFDTTELGDFVIARSVTDPLYHFAVVVDDADMGITHIIRGDDHISNTPRHILIQEAFGIEQPVYVHMPLMLAQDRTKLSKRKGAVAITEYREQGFLPEAVVNYLAILGWNPGSDRELYTMDELIEHFSIEGMQKSPAVFDVEKLKWVHKEHRKKIPREELVASFMSALQSRHAIGEILASSDRAMDDVLERFSIKKDFHDAVIEGEFDFYEHTPLLTKEGLMWKKESAPEQIPLRLLRLKTLLEEVDEKTFLYDSVKIAVWTYAEEEGRGGVLWPLRYALSGKEKSPDPFLLAEALGKKETIARIERAIQIFHA